jgi:hypothetical protein
MQGQIESTSLLLGRYSSDRFMYCTKKICTSINLKLEIWLNFTTVYLSVLGLGLLVGDPASLLHMTVVLLVLLLLLLLLVLPLSVPLLPSRQQRFCEHSHLVQIRLSSP